MDHFNFSMVGFVIGAYSVLGAMALMSFLSERRARRERLQREAVQDAVKAMRAEITKQIKSDLELDKLRADIREIVRDVQVKPATPASFEFTAIPQALNGLDRSEA